MSRPETFALPPFQFQRSEGHVRVKKPVRRFPLRLVHILAGISAAAVVFFGIFKLYGFLLTWEDLEIRSTEVACAEAGIRDRVLLGLRGAVGGNILILDAARIRTAIEADPWVKEARVRKIFPSTLKIEITPRTPEAVLGGVGFLIDHDNILIDRAGPEDAGRLPLLRDAGGFATDREEKLGLAWACLGDLDPETLSRIAALDLSDPADVVVSFRDEAVRLRLGTEDFSRRISAYAAGRAGWESAYGPLEYVDLRFPDRIYLKAIPQEAR